MSRKKRPGEVVCRCPAYPFPHRMMGGYCAGKAFVATFFEAQQYGDCRACPLLEQTDEGFVCRALDGGEPVSQCEALQDHIRFEGIMLYGMNRPPKKGRGLQTFRR